MYFNSAKFYIAIKESSNVYKPKSASPRINVLKATRWAWLLGADLSRRKGLHMPFSKGKHRQA